MSHSNTRGSNSAASPTVAHVSLASIQPTPKSFDSRTRSVVKIRRCIGNKNAYCSTFARSQMR